MSRNVIIAFCGCLSVLLVRPTSAEDLLLSTVDRLKSDIAFLADDAQEGRNVGSEGIARAGEFIASRFDDLGLKTDSFDGTPYQDFSLPGPAVQGAASDNTLAFTGIEGLPTLELGKNYQALALGNSGEFDAPLVFAGYGITAAEHNYDDFADVDVEGKVVIILRKEPQQQVEDSVFDGTRSSQYAFFSSKELNAALHKVAGVIIVNDAATVEANGDQLLGVTAAGSAMNNSQVPTIYCSRDVIDPIVKQGTGKSLSELEAAIDSDLKPRSQLIDGVTVAGKTSIEKSSIPARNVIGVLPGTGELAKEYVVVGAHYDHVGMGGAGSLAPGTVAIHNGADDNASGTTTMLEVARRMAADESENRRTLIFMAFSAEEKGLLGSKYYVRNPRWPLEETVAMVNMDMVGRMQENSLTVFGTGTAEEFDSLIDRLNEKAEFALSKQAAGFGPSDHASFYEKEIPVFHFFTGLHNDYHRPSDDIEKVNYEDMARVANMVTELVSELSTNPERPAYVKTTAVANVGRSRSRNRRPTPRAVLGVQLNIEAETASIAEVGEDSPAAKAGLEAGDVITSIDGNKIASIRDLRAALSQKKPGDTIQMIVKRGEEEVELQVKLGEG